MTCLTVHESAQPAGARSESTANAMLWPLTGLRSGPCAGWESHGLLSETSAEATRRLRDVFDRLIVHEPDDLERLQLPVEPNTLADRTAAGEVMPRHGLIDGRDARSIRVREPEVLPPMSGRGVGRRPAPAMSLEILRILNPADDSQSAGHPFESRAGSGRCG
jgi:hypothetical protein